MGTQELKKIYESKREKTYKNGRVKLGFRETTFEVFQQWYEKSDFERGCHYCGTTNEKSLKLFLLQRNGERPDATRGGKRGKG